MVYPRWKFHNTWKFVQYLSRNTCCMSLRIFLRMAQSPVFVSFLLQHDRCEQTEEWKLHFVKKRLGRKWGVKRGKMNRVLWLARFFKMQKLVDCGTCTNRHENNHYIISFTFFGIMISSWAKQRNTVYFSVINYTQCIIIGSTEKVSEKIN